MLGRAALHELFLSHLRARLFFQLLRKAVCHHAPYFGLIFLHSLSGEPAFAAAWKLGAQLGGTVVVTVLVPTGGELQNVLRR